MNVAPRFDLHVHSRFSPDSNAEIPQFVEQLSLTGLRGFALTDHNSIEGHALLREMQARYPRHILIPGVEVSTREGHLLVYGAEGLPPAHRPLAETLRWVEAHRGVAALAHPFRRFHGVGRQLAETNSGVAIEAVNGHSSAVANAKAEWVAVRRRAVEVGGSDAHAPAELGRAYTECPDDVHTFDDVLAAIREGRCRAGGRSLAGGERWRVALSTLARRAGRGFRPI